MLILEILVATIVGVLIGTITGITPGLHINLVCAFIVSTLTLLLQICSPLALCCFILAMAIKHTFLDAIPSVYLGAPSEDSIMMILPGHKMLIEGKGHAAILLTIIGSFLSLLVSCALAIPLVFLVIFLYPVVNQITGYLLLFLIMYLIINEKKACAALLFLLSSGILGLIVLNHLNMSQPLLPLLSGLFGCSLLLLSLWENQQIPAQKEHDFKYNVAETIAPVTGATIVGFAAAFLPGFGSSQGAIIASRFFKKATTETFLILVGGINTVNMALSIVTLLAIEKARNGAVATMVLILQKQSWSIFAIFICVCVLSAGLSTIIAMWLSKIFSKLICKINYAHIVYSITATLVLMTILFDGIYGISVLATATFLGIACAKAEIAKHYLLGCLLVPVLFYFLL